MKTIFLSLITVFLVSGCGVLGYAIDTTGKVVGAAFIAAAPNQGTDDDD